MRFFFNLAGAIYDPDNSGKDLPDIQAARIYAVAHASEIIRERPELVWLGDEVRDRSDRREQASSVHRDRDRRRLSRWAAPLGFDRRRAGGVQGYGLIRKLLSSVFQASECGSNGNQRSYK